MPIGAYFRTNEYRQIVSEAMRKRWADPNYRKRMSEMRRGEKNSFWGKHHTEETKNKLREKRKSYIVTDETRKKMSLVRRGRKLSEQHRLAMSKVRKGALSWNWKGGVSKESELIRNSIEYSLWREAVYNRDGYKCQKCMEDGHGNLQAHHIVNFGEREDLRFAIDNGITFCEPCHDLFHKKSGFKNNSKDQIEKFLL